MPVPFGVSVGDFVAGIDFLRSVCEAFGSTTGAKAQYEGVISSIRSLRSALERASSVETTQQERQHIDTIIIRQTFLKYECKLHKYHASLGQPCSDKWWRSFARKIQWQRYSKQELDSIQGELAQHWTALQTALSVLQR